MFQRAQYFSAGHLRINTTSLAWRSTTLIQRGSDTQVLPAGTRLKILADPRLFGEGRRPQTRASGSERRERGEVGDARTVCQK